MADTIASEGTYDATNGKWDLGELQRRDRRLGANLPEAATLTIILEGDNAADATATATIANDNANRPYRVCIGRADGSNFDESHCGVDSSWHEGPVYDHRDDNNAATLTARAGTGRGAPALPAKEDTTPAIVVEWLPVADLYGSDILQYEVWRSSSEWERADGAVFCDAYAAICTYIDADVETGQTYQYRVRAVSMSAQLGPWSDTIEKKAKDRSSTVGAPEAPALTATPNEPHGDTQILLTWNKPVENGSAIISYTVEVANRSNGPWSAPTNPPALGPDATSWTHARLPDGTTRYYRIKATNGQGDSPWSNVVEVSTRATAQPSAPENVRAAPDGGNAIDVSWDEPRLPAGHEGWNITRYEVQWSDDGVSRWRGAGSVDGETLTFKHSGLHPGDTRYYRVAARTGRALSQWSYPPYATATTLTGVPAQPTLTARAEAHNVINLKWTQPADNGSEITHYDIQWSEDGRPGSWQALAGVSPADITAYADSDLAPVTTRHYRVRAVNDTGPGTWSRPASATTPVDTTRGVGRPTAPLNLHLLAGDGSIDAVWDPPASDGGSPITRYEVQLDGSTVSDDSTNTYLSIFEDSKGSLLTNGRRYNVRVRAINESGYTGPYAQASAVPNKPQVPPSEPRNVEQTEGHGHIVVTWREPYDPGHPELTGYRVQYRQNCTDNCDDWLPATPISAQPTDRSATITGLDNGTTYQVRVWAVNRAGDSPRAGADGALKATPQQAGDGQGQPPTNPRNLRLSPGIDPNDGEKRSITATWSAPSDRGNPALTGYQVQYRCRWCGYDEWADWTTLTFGDDESTTATRATITGLNPEMDYQVQVKTVDNGYGSGLAIAQTATR
ncbi:MAG: fibronectin type III domain-containing protein [Chloroflexi bacterium]|nr:fibronectin type III domain-containing protein [Chloroflexota bacterium]MYD47387.1 fibronectin type III domain-containing protein [Chloroflexota bacterium]